MKMECGHAWNLTDRQVRSGSHRRTELAFDSNQSDDCSQG